jgi:hypothetical protein
MARITALLVALAVLVLAALPAQARAVLAPGGTTPYRRSSRRPRATPGPFGIIKGPNGPGARTDYRSCAVGFARSSTGLTPAVPFLSRHSRPPKYHSAARARP